MDFDDLDDAEGALGPTMDEVREEALSNAMPEPIEHPSPEGANFAPRGRLKMLMMGSLASNKKMYHVQANTVFKEVPNREQYLDWYFYEGSIKNTADDHQNPEIAELFRPYGPDFWTYFGWENYAQQNEKWPGADEELERLAQHFKKHGPFDGILAFDQGACLAIMAAEAAQEGHPGMKGMFRFLLLFSAHGHKALSDKAHMRPKSPLRIPTFVSWSPENDIAWPITGYEEFALYIHPDFRQVVCHPMGHMPPLFEKDTEGLKCLQNFMDAMRYKLPMKPIMNEETQAMKDFWLPLSRASAPTCPSCPERRLIVVTDPLGMHGPTAEELAEDKNRPFDEHPKLAAIRVELMRQIRGVAVSDFEECARSVLEKKGGGDDCKVLVQGVEYLPEHQDIEWHPKKHRIARWTDQEDEIIANEKAVEQVAAQILESVPPLAAEDCFGIVGIGTGGYVAKAMAKVLIRERSLMPVGLWLVVPPTIVPFSEASDVGALVNCSVRYLVPETAIAGPPWRLELSTLGPFSHGAFEEPAGAVRMVVEEFLRATDDAAPGSED